MSTLPCDCHGHTVRGRLLGAYPVLVKDGVRFASKKRLCEDGIHELLTRHKSDWRDSFFLDGTNEQCACYSCGSIAESLHSLRRFYCTVYVDHKSRRDYSAYYCDECAELISEELVLHA